MPGKEIRDRIVDVRKIKGRELRRNGRNWRIHPQAQKNGMQGILSDLGAADVLKAYVAEDGVLTILDGHLRTNVAPDFEWTVIILDFNDDEALKFLLTYDTITGMAEADRMAMDSIMKQVESEDAQVQELIAAIADSYGLYDLPGNQPEAPEIGPDRADELQQKWLVNRGDIWSIQSATTRGVHRVLCGDCTDPANVDAVLAGKLAHIAWTDPPWNVNYGSNLEKNNAQHYRVRQIENDDLGADFPEFATKFCEQINRALHPGGIIYLVMGAQEWPVIDLALRTAKFHWSSTIIWAKDRPVPSRKDYHTQYEPLWYGWKIGAGRLHEVTDRKQSDVWLIKRPGISAEHPTMKPVELIERSLNNSSRPMDIVFDPFIGSGSTMCAAERSGRICYAIEKDPRYVAVTLERLELMGCKSERAALQTPVSTL